MPLVSLLVGARRLELFSMQSERVDRADRWLHFKYGRRVLKEVAVVIYDGVF